MNVTECLDHRGPQVHVEIGKRLVEENDLCIRHQAAGEGDALALATGQFLDPPLGVAGQGPHSQARQSTRPAISSLATLRVFNG